MSPAEFCREIETYLCRKNDGHLIRVVGPVFDTVCRWAEQGVPIAIARRGIDRYFDRRPSSGPRRRPVRVEFCEADILDAFDEWRRAVGVGAAEARAAAKQGASETAPGAVSARGDGGARGGPGVRSGPGAGEQGESGAAAGAGMSGGAGSQGADDDAASAVDPDVDRHGGASAGSGGTARRKPGLQTHIDRAMARLTQRRVDAGVSGALADAIDRLLGELDALRAGARGARDAARATVVARLVDADRTLLAAARASLPPDVLTALRGDAARELEPFQSRMAPEALKAAIEAALDQLVRDRCRLPDLRAEG